MCLHLLKKMLHQSILTHRSFPFFSTQMAEYSYRAAVRELLPQLCYLDNLRVEERHSSSVMGEDWIILQNAIKDSKSSRTAAEEGLCFKCGLGSLVQTCLGITGCSFFFFLQKKAQTSLVLEAEHHQLVIFPALPLFRTIIQLIQDPP